MPLIRLQRLPSNATIVLHSIPANAADTRMGRTRTVGDPLADPLSEVLPRTTITKISVSSARKTRGASFQVTNKGAAFPLPNSMMESAPLMLSISRCRDAPHHHTTSRSRTFSTGMCWNEKEFRRGRGKTCCMASKKRRAVFWSCGFHVLKLGVLFVLIYLHREMDEWRKVLNSPVSLPLC